MAKEDVVKRKPGRRIEPTYTEGRSGRPIATSIFIRPPTASSTGTRSTGRDIRDFALRGVDFSCVHNILELGCGFGFSTLGFRGKLRPGTPHRGP